jgi:hypothetical protein
VYVELALLDTYGRSDYPNAPAVKQVQTLTPSANGVGGTFVISHLGNSVTVSPLSDPSVISANLAAASPGPIPFVASGGTGSPLATNRPVTLTATAAGVQGANITVNSAGTTGGTISVSAPNPAGADAAALISINPGPLIGAHSINYNARGCRLDQAGELTFEIPLTYLQNAQVIPGMQIIVYEDGRDIGHYAITDESETISGDGHSAQFTCPEQIDELRNFSLTRGFTSLPGESSLGIMQRMAIAQLETPWVVTTPDVGNYASVPFSIYGASILSGISKYTADNHEHFKTGPLNGGRHVQFGYFGTDSGITLSFAGNDPNAEAANPYSRVFTSFGRQRDINVVNDLVITGNGNGSIELDLASLFNPTGATAIINPVTGVAFSGWQRSGVPVTPVGVDPSFYNARFPIGRRPRYDGGGDDGYEYFMWDDYAISQLGGRRRMGSTSAQDIQAASTSPADQASAAARLYVVGLTYLFYHSQVNEQLTIETEARGDMQDMGGKMVNVYLVEQQQGVVVLNLSGKYMVHEHKRVNADSDARDQWTMTSLGQEVQTSEGAVATALNALDLWKQTPARFPVLPFIPIDDYIDYQHPFTVRIPGNLSVVGVLDVSITIYLEQSRSPIMPVFHGHAVTTQQIPGDTYGLAHNTNQLAGDAAGLAHDLGKAGSPLPTHDINEPVLHYLIGGTTRDDQTLQYLPNGSVHVTNRATVPSNARQVYVDPDGFLYTSGVDATIHTTTEQLTMWVNASAGGTGGAVKATSGGTAGVTTPTSGGRGTTTLATSNGAGGNTVATSGYRGNISALYAHGYQQAAGGSGGGVTQYGSGAQGEWGAAWGIFLNSVALESVTLTVNGVASPLVNTTGTTLDISAAWKAQAENILIFSNAAGSASNPTNLGRCRAFVQIREIATTL